MNEIMPQEGLDAAAQLAGQAVDFSRSRLAQEAGRRVWTFSLDRIDRTWGWMVGRVTGTAAELPALRVKDKPEEEDRWDALHAALAALMREDQALRTEMAEQLAAAKAESAGVTVNTGDKCTVITGNGTRIKNITIS